MQANAPDHPLLQAMNKVFEAFSGKGSSEKTSEENKSVESSEEIQKQ